ncbi:hypothetical protein [Gallaecimonas pentaromativorans]|nr:hypothetical protein [Gallaecimonas pentaromativorans]
MPAGWAEQRSYLIEVPPEAAPPSGFPLVLAFHGGGMQGPWHGKEAVE